MPDAHDLSAEAIEARLAELRSLYVPEPAEAVAAEHEDPVDRDLSAAGIERRLAELRDLWRFTQWAHGSVERFDRPTEPVAADDWDAAG